METELSTQIVQTQFSKLMFDCDELQKKYIILDLISEGARSSVFKLRERQTLQIFCGKFINKGKIMGDFHRTLNICKELKTISNKSLPKIHKIFENSDYIIIVLDFCDGVTLKELMYSEGILTKEAGIKISSEICSAIHSLHLHGIAILDLRPENIVIKRGEPAKLVGITNGVLEISLEKKIFYGSTTFAPPEYILNKSYIPLQADSWSFGILMYIVFVGKLPWRCDDEQSLYCRICEGVKSISYSVPIDVANLILQFMDIKPESRLSIDDSIRLPIFRPKIEKQSHKQVKIQKVVQKAHSSLSFRTLNGKHTNMQKAQSLPFFSGVKRQNSLLVPQE